MLFILQSTQLHSMSSSVPSSKAKSRGNVTVSQSPLQSDQGSPSPTQLPNIDSLVISEQHQIASRPGVSQVQRAILARSNYFKLDISGCKDQIAYHFVVRKQEEGKTVARRCIQRTSSLLLDEDQFAHAASNYSDRFYSSQTHPKSTNPSFDLGERH